MSNQKISQTVPPFYNVNDDDFYHGPAWIIKPRLFPPKNTFTQGPGPAYYHIPDRSIYSRPGVTIGCRYKTNPPVSIGLLARYTPKKQYTSIGQMPAISITPRRVEHVEQRKNPGRFYFPLKSTSRSRAPLLRPMFNPMSTLKSSSISPGPATYTIDNQANFRSKLPLTQKHRFPSNGKPVSSYTTNPPFYYPKKLDHQRIPSITIGHRRSSHSNISHTCAPTYYQSINEHNLCSRSMKPGTTLKGRWSPLVCININANHQSIV